METSARGKQESEGILDCVIKARNARYWQELDLFLATASEATCDPYFICTSARLPFLPPPAHRLFFWILIKVGGFITRKPPEHTDALFSRLSLEILKTKIFFSVENVLGKWCYRDFMMHCWIFELHLIEWEEWKDYVWWNWMRKIRKLGSMINWREKYGTIGFHDEIEWGKWNNYIYWKNCIELFLHNSSRISGLEEFIIIAMFAMMRIFWEFTETFFIKTKHFLLDFGVILIQFLLNF